MADKTLTRTYEKFVDHWVHCRSCRALFRQAIQDGQPLCATGTTLWKAWAQEVERTAAPDSGKPRPEQRTEQMERLRKELFNRKEDGTNARS